jgi:PqqD family protein of HPr-rel-A system
MTCPRGKPHPRAVSGEGSGKEGVQDTMHSRLTHLALSDDGFLFDTVTGNTYTLNSSATFILRRLIEGKARGEITGDLCRTYDAGEEIAARDIDQFVQYLLDLEILPLLKNSVEAP